MIRTQVYLRDEQTEDIKLRAKLQNKPEAEVIRELIDVGRNVTNSAQQETAGDALLRFAKLGEKLQVKAPSDLSNRIDDILYGDDE
jgi:hypothetical protein